MGRSRGRTLAVERPVGAVVQNIPALAGISSPPKNQLVPNLNVQASPVKVQILQNTPQSSPINGLQNQPSPANRLSNQPSPSNRFPHQASPQRPPAQVPRTPVYNSVAPSILRTPSPKPSPKPTLAPSSKTSLGYVFL
jgi:hypothetical protein